MRTLACLIVALGIVPGVALAQGEDAAESEAYELFTAAFTEFCELDSGSAAADYYPPESWELSWETDYSDEPETATLYRFFCGAGAYNVNQMYYIETDYGGPQPVSFASPHFEVVYENDDFEGAVVDIPITGYDSQLILTNSEFDLDTGTITSHGLWRGIGDAFSGGTWQLSEGQFILKRFEVDAQYDGEIRPKTLVRFD